MPINSDSVAENAVDVLARRLAGDYLLSQPIIDQPILLDLLQQQAQRIDDAYQHFSNTLQDDVTPTLAAEWLLDNFFIVQQTIRQIREDLPIGYYQQLPKLGNTPLENYPRIYALAHEAVLVDNAQITIDHAMRLLQTFQAGGVVLTMGELWAFPTMLRLGILATLTAALAPYSADNVLSRTAHLLTDENAVGNCITSLRMLVIQDWKDFFERVCIVESILGTDPAGVYPIMDFDTRNRYRTTVEALARQTRSAEDEVARLVVALSIATQLPLPATHVGYYLIGAGRRQLEDALDYRPSGPEAINRWSLSHPTTVYLGGIGLLTGVLVLLSLIFAGTLALSSIQLIGVGILTFLPFTAVAVSLMNWIITHRIAPRLLPRLELAEGVPVECQAMVVIPTLLTDVAEIDSLLQQLELHYLRNTDPHLYFALLTDYSDAPDQHMPGDIALVNRTQAGIATLNAKYARNISPFYLFHRERQWNVQQDTWMGWERKRGKLIEFNRLLRNHETTSYIIKVGDLSALSAIKYVITLDADTILPEDSAHRLIATLAHPLNRAQYDPLKGKVVAGYAILQPRIEVKPTSANQSLFTQIFAGDVGLDLYTRAVSDVYQDFFGEGSYVGKGIYDVDMFEASIAGRVPENTLLSHDLFEGIHARVGLVTDIVLFEEYPARYLSHTRRLHRWIRGDWQLLPWLLPGLPTAQKDTRSPNALTTLDRWKIFDNLRRSLMPLALIVLFACAWSGMIGAVAVWTIIGIAVAGFPLLTGIFSSLRHPSKIVSLGETVRSLRMDAWRWLLAVVFLPYEALIASDAIIVTLVRLFIRRNQLLRWTTAAHTARLFEADRSSDLAWREMAFAPGFSALLSVVIGVINPSALLIALPLLIGWFVSPQVAFRISRPNAQSEPLQALSADQEVALHHLARQTWLFFEQMVGPEDHWLPPDNFQEEPRAIIAHRTSPTNIGLLLLSTLSAYDLGYIGAIDLSVRLQATFDTITGLEHYRGHLLNWYDTQTLESLTPRYISTVDSGNLAGSLIAIKQACLAFPDVEVMPVQRWIGLQDTLRLLEAYLDTLLMSSPDAPVAALKAYTESLHGLVDAIQLTPEHWSSFILWLNDACWAELSRLLVALLASEAATPNVELLSSLRICSERVHQHMKNMQHHVDLFLPWQAALGEPPALFSRQDCPASLLENWQKLIAAFPLLPQLRDLSAICAAATACLETILHDLQTENITTDDALEAHNWCEGLMEKLSVTQSQVQALLTAYKELASRAEAQFVAMDFSFLFNVQRKVFYIGYSVTGGKLDTNCYDLLASEARLGSLLAIAKRDVPQSHWLHLGRPITNVVNTRTLLSWSGTMFEYLMPTLLMESYEQTFLTQSCRAAVDYQIAYGLEKKVPWGISESSYNAFDAGMNYQYHAFGVPGLGFKRGLADDLVITPYASLLALRLRPQEVRQNIDRLDELDMRGRYGFYEAVDYSPSRLALRQDHAIVRSYMAHHQGMILISLSNYLMGDSMIKRFHADPTIQSVEMLLQERIPTQAPIEHPHQDEVIAHVIPQAPAPIAPWSVPIEGALPQVHVLSNGRYSTLISSAGSGYSQWQGIGLTRWQADTTRDDWGTWIYVQDQDSGQVWSATYQPTGVAPEYQHVQFYPHQAVFQRREHDVTLHMQITVAADDDVEIRQITLINEGDQPRRLRLTSYNEVLLASQAEQHPAFNKLFIESEYIPKNNLLVFHRRARTTAEKAIYLGHALVADADDPVTGDYDSDKNTFIGRGMSARLPVVLQGGKPDLSKSAGFTLDPVMALGQDIILEPHAKRQVAYLTLAASSRQEVVMLAERYNNWPSITHAIETARRQNELALRQLKLGASQLALIQQVLAALLYPNAGLRVSAGILSANRKGQNGLWAYSISGDIPILLVRITDAAELALVQELLQAHAYWHNQQVMIDLVILNLHDSTYSSELQGQLRRLVMRSNSASWLNRQGGIFMLNADQINELDRILIQTAARVVLDGSNGSLADQLARRTEVQTRLPLFTPTISNADPVEPTPVLVRPADLRFDNGIGGFSADGDEYAIYLEAGQQTPAPWVNVIANASFGFLVSECGAGYTWSENSSQNRLTPWNNDPVTDSPGEALYLRDEESALVWSPLPAPGRDTEPYLIRHGAGYSTFDHHSQGLKQTTQLFIAPDAPIKFIRLRLENTWSRSRRVTVTYYAEWVLGATRAMSQPYIIPEYDHASGALLARNAYNTEFAERVAFLAASKASHGLTTDRTEFLGRMGDPGHPAALNRIGLSSRVEPGSDPCAALQLHIDLPVGGSETVYFLLGESANRDDTLQLITRYQDPAQVDAAWQATHTFWDGILGTVTVHTPDPVMNIMLNRWLLYQALSCRIWGRTGFYQSSGAFGFRDQLQDVMALILSAPTLARDHILRAARHQFDEGDVLHWWHPPSGRGVRTRFSDDLLWLPFVVSNYVQATGDFAILNEKIPFLRADPLKPDEDERYGQNDSATDTFTLYEHCLRAIKRGSTAGSHGLPLIGTGDWNDGMNRVGVQGRGESVWVGWFLYDVLMKFAPLCERMDDPDQGQLYREQAEHLKTTLDVQGWDGAWYRRAYFDDGTPLGSAQNQECQIDSIVQSWAVLSGAGEPDHTKQAMNAVRERLVRADDGLLLLFTPPFDSAPRDPGYIKGYPPGIRENGGQYTHAAIWVAWAFAQLGNGNEAMKLFNLLNPVSHGDTPDKAQLYRVEPYVIAADVYSVAPHTGRGGWTWYTGSASWMYRLGIEAILGLRRTSDSLTINPCIPAEWDGYDMTYKYGDAVYHVHVGNPQHLNRGVVQTQLDGNVIPNGVIALRKDGATHHIQIELGKQ